jgi:hypothetical protein
MNLWRWRVILALIPLVGPASTWGAPFTVTTTLDAGPGSLRQAIIDANGNAGPDTIVFNIPASDPNCNATTHVCTITPTAGSPVPFITDRVTIDGYSQPGASPNTVANGDNAVLLIALDGSVPNSGPSLELRGAASGSVIKGLVIENASFGILVKTNSIAIEGCFIGIDPSGTLARPNSNGVFAEFNTPTSGMRIGGTTPAARNVISGNLVGIYFQSGANHVVQGNFIGTNRTGTAAVANGTAIDVQQSDDVLIGGTTVQERNIIANITGIVVSSAARTRIQGNFIGTDVTGTVALGNHFNTAVNLDAAASATQIGGLTATPGMPPGNVIAGSGTGLQIGTGSNNVTNTTVMGNLIGTDAGGTNRLGNLRGVEMVDPSNTVGGTDPMARNVISGNDIGISFTDRAHNNKVQGNFIGTDITGTQLLGNGDGVVVSGSNNTIGGISTIQEPNPGNLIAGNSGRGVNVFFSPTGIAVLGNSIHSNGSLGIDLNGDGVTPNDAGDADTGANNLQNHPLINLVTISNGNATIAGTLNSTPSSTFRLEFFANDSVDPSGFGEGQTFLGFTNVTTDTSGNAPYNVSFPVVSAPRAFSATATDSTGNTSEFSPAFGTRLLNISTRMKVLTGENVLIGGFIITGTGPKKVIVRGLGPTLPVSGPLADPTLELHGSVSMSNDNWKDSQRSEIEATGIPPTNDADSALVASLPPGNYTAILAGKNDTTGIGLVEAYDLDQSAGSALANISTRGFVDIGDNVMIGGFIIGPATTGAARVLLRAIGPSLSASNIQGALQDPTLELHDGSGAIIATNDNWKANDTGGSQQAEIEATTIPPSDDRESALVRILTPGNYTAIVRGKSNSTGVALVELYNLP